MKRAEAVKMVKEQMDILYHYPQKKEHPLFLPDKSFHHYGWCEIQQLLDQIYGENSKGEKVEPYESN